MVTFFIVINLIVTAILLLISVINGIKRRTFLSGIRLVILILVAAISIPVTIGLSSITKPLFDIMGKLIMNSISSTAGGLEGQIGISSIISSLAESEIAGTIADMFTIFFMPFSYVIIFFILDKLSLLLLIPFGKLKEKLSFKNVAIDKLSGAIIGVACALIASFIYLMPLNSYFGYISDVSDKVTTLSFAGGLKSETFSATMESLSSNPILNIYQKAASPIFGTLTASLETKTSSVLSVARTADSMVQIFTSEDKTFDIKKIVDNIESEESLKLTTNSISEISNIFVKQLSSSGSLLPGTSGSNNETDLPTSEPSGSDEPMNTPAPGDENDNEDQEKTDLEKLISLISKVLNDSITNLYKTKSQGNIQKYNDEAKKINYIMSELPNIGQTSNFDKLAENVLTSDCLTDAVIENEDDFKEILQGKVPADAADSVNETIDKLVSEGKCTEKAANAVKSILGII